MANTTTLPGDLVVNGNLRITGNLTPALERTSLAEDALQTFTVPMSAWRVFDAYASPLAATGGTDDLWLIGGAHATAAPSLQTADFGGNGAAAPYYARAEIPLPMEYVAGGAVTIRVHAGMLTTVASEACTVDVTVYKSDEDSTPTEVAITEVAQDMNDLTFADIDFTVTTPSSLSPGDILDVLLTVSADDDENLGEMYACIGSVQLLCDVKG